MNVGGVAVVGTDIRFEGLGMNDPQEEELVSIVKQKSEIKSFIAVVFSSSFSSSFTSF